MGNVGWDLPTEIPKMPFDRQTWKSVQQGLGSLRRLFGPIELRQSRRAQGQHLKVSGI
jgi:hypothetical protein